MPLAVLVVFATCGCDSEESGPSETSVKVPLPELSTAENPVAGKIRQARDLVLAAPESAQNWGHLGVVLDAHAFAEEAVQCYQRAHELDREDARWPYLAAYLLATLDPQVSLQWFEIAERLQPQSVQIRTYLADALLRVGQEQQAREQFLKMLEIDPDWRPALLGLAELALRRDQLDAAQAHLQRALELESADREVHAKLARLYTKQGLEEAAREATLLTQAYPQLAPIADVSRAFVEREGVSARAYIERGLRAVRNGSLKDAESWFRQAHLQRPDNVRNELNLAGVLAQLGQFDESLAILEKLQEKNPEDVEVCLNFGATLLRAQRLDEAQEQLLKVREREPENPDGLFNWGLLCERKRRLPEALESYKQAVTLRPTYAEGHAELGRLLLVLKRPQAALEHWERAQRYGVSRAGFVIGLALCQSQVGDFAAAEQTLRVGLQRFPEQIDLMAALATILATCPDAAVRDGKEGLQLAQRLVELQGEDVAGLNLLAAAQAESGDFEAAEQSMQRAVELASKSGRVAVVTMLQSRLELYRSGQPWHQVGPAGQQTTEDGN
jgi:tetratricopeptide (TPR) repeat protein